MQSRGEKLLDFITSAGLITANVEYAPTFIGPRRIELIGLTICLVKILELIKE